MPLRMGPLEIALILVVILVVFGVGKLPEVGGAIGRGLRAFRRGQHNEDDEEEMPKSRKKVTKKGTSDSAKRKER